MWIVGGIVGGILGGAFGLSTFGVFLCGAAGGLLGLFAPAVWIVIKALKDEPSEPLYSPPQTTRQVSTPQQAARVGATKVSEPPYSPPQTTRQVSTPQQAARVEATKVFDGDGGPPTMSYEEEMAFYRRRYADEAVALKDGWTHEDWVALFKNSTQQATQDAAPTPPKARRRPNPLTPYETSAPTPPKVGMAILDTAGQKKMRN
jgi:hypothetical protein